MDEQELKQIYQMVDSIPFSRTKKNIGRDFADGVMMAELLHHYKPKLVELHNYPAANSYIKKINNWTTLDKKVLRKLGLHLTAEQIADIVNSTPNAIQIFLYRVFKCMESPEEEAKISRVQRNSFRPRNEEQVNGNTNPNVEGNRSLEKGVKIGNIRSGAKNIPQKNINPVEVGQETQQIMELVDQIEQSYAQILKLQEISKLKDDVIKNLQKKVEQMMFG